MQTLRVEQVTKRYGKLTAVDNVSFEAVPGRILGLLGPNGAGKTSTIRMIAYITAPDEGRIRFGEMTAGPRTQELMGYLPEERGLYPKMKVGEQLVYFGELKGLSRKVAKERVDYWLGRFDATDWFDQKTSELSKGMQQKVQFIATILHGPELLILDEPFGGLDPINTEVLQDVIQELKTENRTILFASHRMEQVEQLCDDICLVSRGEIVLSGSLNEIKRRYERDTILLDFEGGATFLDRFERQGRIRIDQRSTRHAEIKLLGGTPSRDILMAAMAETDEIMRFDLVEPPMREIFVKAVTEQQGHDAHAIEDSSTRHALATDSPPRHRTD